MSVNTELPFDSLLLNALAALPDRQRECVALRVLLDLSTEQTAEVLGIAPGTVTTHLHRGLATLRRDLAVPHACCTPDPKGMTVHD